MARQDACTLLDEDHNLVARLFQQYKAAHQDNEKLLLARRICQELTVHTRIEDEIFYPAFQQASGDEALVGHARHEHDEARQLIDRIDASPKPQDRTMLDLEDAVLHHINDEREKMFPRARQLKDLDLMALADRLEQRKAELMAGQPA